MNSPAAKHRYTVYSYTVYECGLGDVEDPDIYAAQPLYEWQQTDAGRWVMEHATETPSYHISADPSTFGYKCTVRASFDERTAVEYCLRYAKF